jgi:hypothetical protein
MTAEVPAGIAGKAALRLVRQGPQRWIWSDPVRRARNLLRFAETEADGGRDILRAAELTDDPRLRRLFLRHAADEQRHAQMFRARGGALLRSLSGVADDRFRTDWLAPGERGLDDLRVEAEGQGSLLAFLHLSEKSAARDFALYRDVLDRDPVTHALFDEILRDEAFHMTYTLAQLKRVAPRRSGWLLWGARLNRLWKGYLRAASALANLISGIVLTLLYFLILPPFAFLAMRAAAREAVGWTPVAPARGGSLRRQY